MELLTFTGAVITVLRDSTILQQNLQSLGTTAFSSTDIIRRLQYLVSYVSLSHLDSFQVLLVISLQTQCELFGHVSVDGSLTVIVIPKSSEINELLVSLGGMVKSRKNSNWQLKLYKENRTSQHYPFQ